MVDSEYRCQYFIVSTYGDNGANVLEIVIFQKRYHKVNINVNFGYLHLEHRLCPQMPDSADS
jgi:hypothetical protein